MKKDHLSFTAAILLLLTLTAFTVDGYSDGPPDAHTGGTGEPTCATSGCHDNAEPDTGDGECILTTPSAYTPGEPHHMGVLIAGHAEKGGFELKAVDDEGNSAGNFTFHEENLVQVSEHDGVIYVKQTAEGAGRIDWQMEWMAPPAGTGRVTFYVAGVAANNDSTPDHDNVFTAEAPCFEIVEDDDDDDPGFAAPAAISAIIVLAVTGERLRRSRL